MAEDKSKEKPKKKTISKTPLVYYEGVGRRKTASARVRLYPKDKKKFLVNEKPLEEYFANKLHLIQEAMAPLELLKMGAKLGITVHTKGGGTTGQAGAIRHGLARALVKFNPDFRQKLSKANHLTRDSRMVERKKPGLKKARKAPQWGKR